MPAGRAGFEVDAGRRQRHGAAEMTTFKACELCIGGGATASSVSWRRLRALGLSLGAGLSLPQDHHIC